MPDYDNVCRYLAEHFSSDFASWLLGEAIALSELSPTELSLAPIRADSLIFLQSESLVLHLEFQTEPDEEIPFRMADYRLRLYRRFPEREVRQVAIYLRRTRSPLAFQNWFALPNTRHQFEIIRLWEQPTALFLSSEGLWPFAVLTEPEQAAAILEEVSDRLERLPAGRRQSDLAASSSVLAGLVLEKHFIRHVLRRDIMRDSVIYQEILAEGAAQGADARSVEIARDLMTMGLSVEQIAQVTRLSVDRVRQLQQESE